VIAAVDQPEGEVTAEEGVTAVVDQADQPFGDVGAGHGNAQDAQSGGEHADDDGFAQRAPRGVLEHVLEAACAQLVGEVLPPGLDVAGTGGRRCPARGRHGCGPGLGPAALLGAPQLEEEFVRPVGGGAHVLRAVEAFLREGEIPGVQRVAGEFEVVPPGRRPGRLDAVDDRPGPGQVVSLPVDAQQQEGAGGARVRRQQMFQPGRRLMRASHGVQAFGLLLGVRGPGARAGCRQGRVGRGAGAVQRHELRHRTPLDGFHAAGEDVLEDLQCLERLPGGADAGVGGGDVPGG
jgi:hypothetical protein